MNGCAFCGVPEREHGIEYDVTVKFHLYVSPTDEQRKQRLLDRQAKTH